MASVTNTSNSTINWYDPNSSSTTASSQATTSSSSSSSGTAALANESTFLTLLVAQLKNQDPSQPADGTQFVTQLAQFSSLEQNLAMRTDLDSINSKIPTSTSSTASTSTSSTASSQQP